MGRLNIVSGNILNYLDGKDLFVNSTNIFLNVNESIITSSSWKGIDILHIYCPKYYESETPMEDLLNSYNNIFIEANKNGYKNIISFSLGTREYGYKHNDIATSVVNKLNELVNKYDIDFMLVLNNEKIKELYIF